MTKKKYGLWGTVWVGMCCLLMVGGAKTLCAAKDGGAEQINKSQKYDDKQWRDTLFVLMSRPSFARTGVDVIFTNKKGTRQMVNNMTDNVTAVDYGDVVVINEDCHIIQLLERNQKLENFVKQK